MTRKTKMWIGGGLALALVAATGSWAGVSGQQRPASPRARGAPQVAPEADRVLREMSEYLAGLPSFRVNADSVLEAVLEDGQKLQFVASSQVMIRRPDKLRSERHGAQSDVALYYDGSAMTFFGRHANVWATVGAPRTLDEAIEFARNELDIDAPAADLLTSDPYTTLMEDVRSGMYVGEEEIGGAMAHHLAFRNNGGTDWQVWVQEGATPLPLRYVVTSTDVRSQPQFEVALHDWDTSSQISDADFQFEPPPDARQIEFLRAMQQREETPERQHRQQQQQQQQQQPQQPGQGGGQ